jgi:hypothetical protein
MLHIRKAHSQHILGGGPDDVFRQVSATAFGRHFEVPGNGMVQ